MPTAAAFGIRSHSGWATLVAATGSAAQGRVVERRRIALIEAGVPRQPYHAAEPLPFAKAEALLGRALASVTCTTGASLAAALADARDQGLEVRGVGLLTGSGRPLPSLDKILQSHALIHAAEGELYREAIRAACQAAKLRVVGIPEKQIRERGAAMLRGPEKLQARLLALGRELGPRWREDEKHAALAAWAALAAGVQGRSAEG